MTEALWVTLALLAVPVVLLLATTGCFVDATGTGGPPDDEEVPPPDEPPPDDPPPDDPPPDDPPLSYEETVLMTEGLLGYWRLGEMIDAPEAVNSFAPGILNGAYVYPGITLELQGALVPNDLDTAALFEGTTGIVEVDMQPLTGGEVTVELWMKLVEEVPDWGVLVGCYEPVLFGPEEIIATGYRLRARTTGPGQIEVEANIGGMMNPLVAQVAEGTTPVWHHVVLTYLNMTGQERAELYVDGEVSTLDGTFNVQTPAPLRFGGGHPGTFGQLAFPYAGLLDDVALYLSYLPQAEIEGHLNAVNP
jgi:Concanavalin A-like lectin/glucanases superfamily